MYTRSSEVHTSDKSCSFHISVTSANILANYRALGERLRGACPCTITLSFRITTALLFVSSDFTYLYNFTSQKYDVGDKDENKAFSHVSDIQASGKDKGKQTRVG